MTGFYRQGSALVCDGVPLDRIAAVEGTPLYVYSAATIASRYRAIDEAFAGYPHAIHYALKANSTLAITRLLQARGQEALEAAEAELHDVFRNLALAMIHHAQCRAAESDAALQTLISEFGWTAAYQVAEAYAYRNEVDKAFEWLERAYGQRDPGVTYSATDVLLRSLHGDPRWQPFLKRLGLT